MLLVVTNKADLASDYFILRLKERGIPFVRLNTEDYGTRFQIDIAVGATADFVIRCDNGESFASDAISAVYFRQPRTPHISNEIAPSDRAFAARELKEVLRGLWRVIPARLWLNHPRNLWLASNKIEQLHLARDFGLSVPETCITNSRSSVREFYDRHEGQIICKAVKNGFSHADNIVTMATTKRVEADFIERFDEYAMLPMIYQREIIKNCDVRVTIVGDKIYATAIYSQEHADTEVDWRVWDVSNLDLRHEPITLPVDIAEGCRKITAHFGLRYAAIDLVLGQDGRWYFLELNPNGQWAWIEKKAGYPIRDAIIECLQGRKGAYGWDRRANRVEGHQRPSAISDLRS
jgi:hypothetical protein